MALRQKVITVYRKILRVSQKWEAIDPRHTEKERRYIKDETRQLFRQNKEITSEDTIMRHIQEAEARLDLAIHYGIPYPRPVNLPQNVLPPTSKKSMKKRQRIVNMSKPVYIKSYDKDKDS